MHIGIKYKFVTMRKVNGPMPIPPPTGRMKAAVAHPPNARLVIVGMVPARGMARAKVTERGVRRTAPVVQPNLVREIIGGINLVPLGTHPVKVTVKVRRQNMRRVVSMGLTNSRVVPVPPVAVPTLLVQK